MTEALKQHIRKFIATDEDSLENIIGFFEPLQVKKKETILAEGQLCRYQYFVANGCLRLFFINDKGVEQTTHFALENWWLSDYMSFNQQQPSGFFIQAVEASELLAIDHLSIEKLLQEHPSMERYFRIVHQRAHGAAQNRIKIIYSSSGGTLYYGFRSKYPDFVQRVPQYQLASFLNITPEYLSELRKKKLS